MNNQLKHIPVMKKESIDALVMQKNGIYVDATFGFGGHSKAILDRLNGKGRLYALDKDPDSIRIADKVVVEDERFTLKHGCFSSLESKSKEWEIYGSVNGILFDLGVSSNHLDDPGRGFSFSKNGPIDMRFNQKIGVPAGEWLSTVSEDFLGKVIREYGEERYAKKIAKRIVSERKKAKITNTFDLARIINETIPKNEKNKNNATRTFQAIRIHINQELEVLRNVLESTYNILAPKGRLVLITYHSLEDRVIKDFLIFSDKSLSAPRDLPLSNKFLTKMFRLIFKSIKPSQMEIKSNIRSRSAKLNVLEKYGENNH